MKAGFAATAGVIGIGSFFTFFVLGLFFPTSPLLGWGHEDGPVETLAAVFWGAACLVCIAWLVRGEGPRMLTGFWAAFSLLCGGEEISWGQRIFGYATPPSVKEINGQGEFNLHNLNAPDLGPWFNVQYAFLLGFTVYFLVLPLVSALRRAAETQGYRAPSTAFTAMVWSVIGASYVLQALGAEVAVRVIAESRETFYAFVVFAYVCTGLGSPAAKGLVRAIRAA